MPASALSRNHKTKTMNRQAQLKQNIRELLDTLEETEHPLISRRGDPMETALGSRQDCTKEPAPAEAHIYLLIGESNGALCGLHEKISTLVTRLEPVKRQGPLRDNGGCGISPSPFSSPLAVQLLSIIGGIRAAESRLSELESELELPRECNPAGACKATR